MCRKRFSAALEPNAAQWEYECRLPFGSAMGRKHILKRVLITAAAWRLHDEARDHLLAGQRTSVDLFGNGAERAHQVISGQVILHEVECGLSCDRNKAADSQICHACSPQVIGGGAETVKE